MLVYEYYAEKGDMYACMFGYHSICGMYFLNLQLGLNHSQVYWTCKKLHNPLKVLSYGY